MNAANWIGFLGGCLQATEEGALGDVPMSQNATKDPEALHQALERVPGWYAPGEYTECPRCSRPGDLLKKGSKCTLERRAYESVDEKSIS